MRTMFGKGFCRQCPAKGSVDNVQVENFLRVCMCVCVCGGGGTTDNVRLRVPWTISKLKIFCGWGGGWGGYHGQCPSNCNRTRLQGQTNTSTAGEKDMFAFMMLPLLKLVCRGGKKTSL